MQWGLDPIRLWLETHVVFILLPQWTCLARPIVIELCRVYRSIALTITFFSVAHVEPSSIMQASQKRGCFQGGTILTSPYSTVCRYTTLKLPNLIVSYPMIQSSCVFSNRALLSSSGGELRTLPIVFNF